MCVSGAALRQFSQQEKTAEHSAQSMSWEEGRQEDAQPGDSWPLHPWRPFPVSGPGIASEALEVVVLTGF